jgi:hypothetical protein
MILNATSRPYREDAAAASESQDGRGENHGRGYKSAPEAGQAGTPLK